MVLLRAYFASELLFRWINQKRHLKYVLDIQEAHCYGTYNEHPQLMLMEKQAYPSEASCSKLTTSVVNVSLKFQT